MKLNKQLYILFALLVGIMAVESCKEENKKGSLKEVQAEIETSFESNLKAADFDTIIEGKPVKLYWLKKGSLQMAMTNYGGRIVGLWTPDKNGKLVDVCIGRGSTEAYVNGPESYFGATIGRVGNRIAAGKFKIDGKEYTIAPNNNANALHGGEHGFQDKVWEAHQPNAYTLELSYTSPDMEEGFPGNLKTVVVYTLTENNSVNIEYSATSDKPTIVNLTNHAYFNLNGEGSGTILNHRLQINANTFTPVDQGLIPLGELRPVAGTPFDFRDLTAIGERIEASNEQLSFGGGYDHNFVLVGQSEIELAHAAKVVGDTSGIVMDVYTQEPGIQFYCGNFMNAENELKSGAKDDFRTAFCLETQHFPDSPNQKDFPTIELRPGETYHTVSRYTFSVE